MKRIRAAFAAVFSHASAAVLAAFFVAGCTVADPAPDAAATCADSAEIYASLADGRGEIRRIVGATLAGQAMELWSSPGGATWTVMLTARGGRTCLLAAGEGLTMLRRGPGQ